MNPNNPTPNVFEDLPVDSDIEVGGSASGVIRSVHLRARYLLLVALGGAIGTGIREAFALAFPSKEGGFPLTIFVINVVGAFVLGCLLETLSRRGPDEGRRRSLRLLIGTGVLGGFTTYSSFATDTAGLTQSALTTAFLYAATTLVIGFVASGAGVSLSAAAHRRLAEGKASR